MMTLFAFAADAVVLSIAGAGLALFGAISYGLFKEMF